MLAAFLFFSNSMFLAQSDYCLSEIYSKKVKYFYSLEANFEPRQMEGVFQHNGDDMFSHKNTDFQLSCIHTQSYAENGHWTLYIKLKLNKSTESYQLHGTLLQPYVRRFYADFVCNCVFFFVSYCVSFFVSYCDFILLIII